jgi:hypothetical protein
MRYVLSSVALFVIAIAQAQTNPVPVKPTIKVQPKTVTTPNQNNNTSSGNANVGSATTSEPASKLIRDGKEPAGIQGYIVWVDPVTQKKHFIKGQDDRSGEWRYAYEYPTISVEFSKNGTIEWATLNSGNYYVPVDSLGRELSKYSTDWRTPPAAFRYNIKFRFDLNYNGAPVVLDDQQTIRYNPNIYKFYDVKIPIPFTNANAHSGVTVPLEDFPDRPIEQKRRITKFTDLPDIN